MSPVIFHTGKPHQERVATWARQRLADAGGRNYSRSQDQDGVLFADGVGQGKTWEALAAAALILYSLGRQRGQYHVLILCPANLITKWEDELEADSAFRKRLTAWKKKLSKSGDKQVAQCTFNTLTQVLPIRSGAHVRTKLKHRRFQAAPGTYLVSHNLISRRGTGLSALRRQKWDLVIVDEAHNAAARKALSSLQERRRIDNKLLLTATPFQLEPRQLNGVTQNLLRHAPRVLKKPVLRDYIEQLRQFFDGHGAPPPRARVREASDVLRPIIARNQPPAARRTYDVLLMDGATVPLGARLDQLSDERVRSLLEALRTGMVDDAGLRFESAYLEKRFDLALGGRHDYIATTLRRLLSSGIDSTPSPRFEALDRWAKRVFVDDLRDTLEQGQPRKTLVFTSWVGGAQAGEAVRLSTLLAGAFKDAVDVLRGEHPERWNNWHTAGVDRLGRQQTRARKLGHGDAVYDAFSALANDEITAVLVGRHSSVATSIWRWFASRMKSIEEDEKALAAVDDRRSFEARALRRRLNDHRALLSVWSTKRKAGPVARYTGNENRYARDSASTAFREIGPPWVLVASNVGAEGIDLQTYTRRVVHYDLEWNPAKMEQREGRGDRVGRRLREPLQVLYCIVPRTYDERMFHQLVARDRWHGVLLGKAASALADSERDARMVETKALEKARLDLAPQ